MSQAAEAPRYTFQREVIMLASKLRWALFALVLAAAPSAAGCYATVDAPGVEYGYQPIYTDDGYVVYYDNGGRPYYYNGGRTYYIHNNHPYYRRYTNHYSTYRGRYNTWYSRSGHRYRTYRRR
jgi:hypothetical protein